MLTGDIDNSVTYHLLLNRQDCKTASFLTSSHCYTHIQKEINNNYYDKAVVSNNYGDNHSILVKNYFLSCIISFLMYNYILAPMHYGIVKGIILEL